MIKAWGWVVDLLVVLGRLREQPLRPLDLTMLCTHHRLGGGQPGQRLVAIAWQQQALRAAAEAAALGQVENKGSNRWA
jgi:hypothetical protein